MGKLLLLATIGIFLTSCIEKKNPKEEQKDEITMLRDSLSGELENILKQGYINGFGVAIVNEDTTLFEKGFGYADVKAKKPYSEHTIQNIGSVSKTLIGIALLKAQEMGKLNLDDPINNYLPFLVNNPNHPQEQITIRHLTTHSSTILDTEYYNSKAYVLKEGEELSSSAMEGLNEVLNPADSKVELLDFLDKLLSPKGEWYSKEGFSKNRPGEVFEYSNIGATLAAAILEIAVKQSYGEFTTEYILNPLKMSSSGWSFETVELESHSKLYANPETELPLYGLISYPDGGLITSISDFSTYLTELIKGHSGKGLLIKDESYKELFKEQLGATSFPERDEEDDYDDEYNTGIFMGFTPRGYIGHTGGDPGIAAYMFFDPKTKIGRILIINTSVRNSGGVEEFYSIWNTLGDYEVRLNNISSQ